MTTEILFSVVVQRKTECINGQTLHQYGMVMTNPIHGNIVVDMVMDEETVQAMGGDQLANQNAISAMNLEAHEEIARRNQESLMALAG